MQVKIIPISDLYIAYPEYLKYRLSQINTDERSQKMLKDIDNLPPIPVIEFDNNKYSISDGYHRLAINIFLGREKVKINILN